MHGMEKLKKRVNVEATLNRSRRPRGGVDVYFYSFSSLGSRLWLGGQHHALALYPLDSSIVHCIGGRVGHRADLDGRGKSHPDLDFIPVPSSP